MLLQIASFLFLYGIEPFFDRQFSKFSMCRSKKRCSLIFDLGPLTPKIYSPKFAQNRLPRYKSACMPDRPEMFGPTGGFRGWPIQWNHAECCGAHRCCHGNDIWV